MSELNSELDAEIEVNKSLRRHIKYLEGIIRMKILMDLEGKLYKASQFEEISREDLEKEAQKHRDKFHEIKSIEKRADEIKWQAEQTAQENQSQPAQPEQPQQPAQPTPEPQPVPQQIEQPVPNPAPLPAQLQ